MKKTKIFRDLRRQDLSAIAIGEDKTEPEKGSNKPENCLDLSMIDRQKSVFTAESKKVLDIQKNVSGNHKPEKYIFVERNIEKTKASEKIGELIRLAAAGTLILFLINAVNVYQHGITIKNDLIATATSGYDNLVQAGNESKQTDFSQANDSFAASSQNFDDALASLRFLATNQNVFFAKQQTIESVQNLLEAGKNISEAGTEFTKGIIHLRDLPALFLQNNAIAKNQLTAVKAQPVDENTLTPKVPLTTVLEQDLGFLNQASDEVDTAGRDLALVSDDVLPLQMQPKLAAARIDVTRLQSILQTTREEIPTILTMLGQRVLHRYLILLQNDAEARPTGGFIGSYLIVDVDNGNVINTEFHDVYETDGQLQENIPPPEDMAGITKNWRMRDSNYSPDFAISAEKAAWFLQKEKGPSVDSVIAVNQSFISNLFDITGPVKLDSLQAPLTKDNWQTVISYLVESKASGKTDPKKILRSFIPAFAGQLMASKDIGQIIKTAIQGLQDRRILMHSRNADVENLFDRLGVSGLVIRTNPGEDYLQVITTSIGGNKSDLYIRQSIKHSTVVSIDGTMNDAVSITRTHTWTDQTAAQIVKTLGDFGYSNLSPGVESILGGGDNKSVIKVYVPQGAVLQNAIGVDPASVETRSDDDLQKTYFMFQLDVPAGTSGTVSLSYQLPQKLDTSVAGSYHFFAQRQPGIVQSSLENDLIVKQGLKIYQSYPDDLTFPDSNQAVQQIQLQNDDYMAALVGAQQ